jgi:hypothetical protein
MVPSKIKLVAVINILLSLVFLVVFSLIFIGSMVAAASSSVYGILAIVALISIVGWCFLFIGSILLLFGKKAGFYLLMISWIFNLPNMSSLPGILLFFWMSLSIDMVRNNEESRAFLKLSDTSFWEKPWKDKKEQAKNKTAQQQTAQEPAQKQEQDALFTYIQDTKAKGYSDAQIKAVLLNSGYSESLLKNYFK